MKKYIVIGLATVTFLLNSCTNGQSQNGQTNLAANEFSAKIKANANSVIVDVRTPDEFSKGHLQNAQNIDWRGNDFDKQINSLDKSKPVFVYCLSGGRSSSAASFMRSNGFKEVYELDGGIMKWRGANLPETTATTSRNLEMTKQQFEVLLNSDKLVLIDFYADWCAPCQKMKPYLDEITQEMSNKVTVVRVNADDNQALCKELKIDALPVLQMYKNKTLTWTNVGYIDKVGVVAAINQ
ncbi:Thiosulfate sulfurtransferase GlpE [Emticicia aquatica]|jgi:thioredoxin|uniref:Thiosulfate sulfurtransferase GlpE n=1 Tax=Emticicia aquatica TaxID=1681835 RepID=A0ABM9AKP5_9BACT|nr:thioredoxin domain-containing protein [Emticicia aquatica]CAH0994340.1 Thiosulfate sulfurtransferase GlpE [Emticicia aquatica]